MAPIPGDATGSRPQPRRRTLSSGEASLAADRDANAPKPSSISAQVAGSGTTAADPMSNTALKLVPGGGVTNPAQWMVMVLARRL